MKTIKHLIFISFVLMGLLFAIQQAPASNFIVEETLDGMPLNTEVDEQPDNANLVGLIVRHGDIIDAVKGVYQNFSKESESSELWIGQQIGGDGGGATLLIREGYAISSIRLIYGNYFGAQHILKLKVIWTALDRSGRTIESEYLGTTNFATNIQEPIQINPEGDWAIGLGGDSFHHTDGSHFISTLFLH